MSVHCNESGRKNYEERPELCPWCGCASWWNGVRVVAEVVLAALGMVSHEAGVRRQRVKCSNPGCGRSWTIYPAASYPHRVFQPDVVASAVAQLASGQGETAASIARSHTCSVRSVWRWTQWVAGLAEPEEVGRTCAKLAPAEPPGDAQTSSEATECPSRAGKLVRLLDRLALILDERGVDLPGHGCGLARILAWQLREFRAISYLTKSSPPLRMADLAGAV